MANMQGLNYYTKEEVEEKFTAITTPFTITHSSVNLANIACEKIGKVATLTFDIGFTANMATNTFTDIGTVNDDIKPAIDLYFSGRQPWSGVICDFRIKTTGEFEVVAHGNTNNEGFHGSVSWVTAS